jgi:hypothetical protein
MDKNVCVQCMMCVTDIHIVPYNHTRFLVGVNMVQVILRVGFPVGAEHTSNFLDQSNQHNPWRKPQLVLHVWNMDNKASDFFFIPK